MKSLDLIKQDLLLARDQIKDNEGELTAALEKELESITHDLAIKADHYAYRIDRLKNAVMYWDNKIRDYQAVKKAIQSHLENMNAKIKNTMLALDTQVINGEEYTFNMRASSQPRLVIDKEIADLPAEYVIHVTELKADNEKIKEDLKNGTVVDNCHLEYSQTLTIKPKKD